MAAAQRAIANFVNIVTGKSIPVKFQSNDSSFTDGTTVTIGTKLDGKNFDPAVGLALHEGSHIAHTDFSLFKGANGKYTSNIGETHSQLLEKPQSVKHSLLNQLDIKD